ncbi:unnamed protein product, partial [marine sediment metagenome]
MGDEKSGNADKEKCIDGKTLSILDSVAENILSIRGKNYRSLTPYVHKLANQIELGFPANEALENIVVDVRAEKASKKRRPSFSSRHPKLSALLSKVSA